MTEYDGYKYIEGGICAAKGFKANGLNCGLNTNPQKNDLCILKSDIPCNCAGVYTQNKVKGAPVVVTQNKLKNNNGVAQAVIANSKNANTCNSDGIDKANMMCDLAADALGIDASMVLVASTGVIGQPLPIEPIKNHIQALCGGLSVNGNEKAATAIMTTDTVKKEVALEFELDGKICRIGGMAKGSGMIHPNMATTLNFITTDVNINNQMLQKALSQITKITYNCLSIDGDTSTNDMVIIMANGLAGNNAINSENEAYQKFSTGLYAVMSEMTKMLAKDGEGATKMIECSCKSAPNLDTAIIVAKSVIRSPLLKCAVFGEDANWGRILCAIGYSEAEFDINKVDVDISSSKGSVSVCKNGAGVYFSEETASEILAEDEIFININLNQGSYSAKAWGCDLTYDYVRINGDYRS